VIHLGAQGVSDAQAQLGSGLGAKPRSRGPGRRFRSHAAAGTRSALHRQRRCLSGYFLTSSAVLVTAWPAEETSLPAPDTVLQAARAMLPARAINRTNFGMASIQDCEVRIFVRKLPATWFHQGVPGAGLLGGHPGMEGSAIADWA
jgi:hypothetical protein